MSKEKLFCSKPFQWFEVSQGTAVEHKGDVYMCCPSWLETPVGNLKHQSVTEVWNGEKAQELRSSILDGSFKYCNASRCPFLQTTTGPVQKVKDVQNEDLKTIINNQLTVLPYGPREINCCYDRSCNLSCPSCRSEVIVELENEQQILDIQNKIRNEALTDAQFIYITGSGDPFGSPFFRKWLQTMKRQEMPNLKEIHLHSNAQLWTPKIWDTIPEDIRPLITSAEISIDAASAETYSINRRGGSFEKLLQNLEFISELRKKGPLQAVTISMVVQANNFKEMPNFVKLGKRFGFDTIYFSQIVNWGTFSEEEFANRAVHQPTHPKYFEFVNVLKNRIFNQPTVYLGNLTEIRSQATPNAREKVLAAIEKVFSNVPTK